MRIILTEVIIFWYYYLSFNTV